MPDGDTQQTSQYGSVENVINYCSYRVSIVRQPSVETPHEDIDYFAGDITQNVLEIEVRETIDQFYRTGKVVIADKSMLRETLPFTGNEIVSVRYKNRFHSGLSNLKDKVVHFKIFHIEEYEDMADRSNSPGGSYVVFHLVEWPAFDFLSTIVYQTFKTSTTPGAGVRASTLIEDLLKGINGFENHYDINVDPSQEDLNFTNFWIPRWTITKAIKYINQFMVNAQGFPFYFFGVRSNPEGVGNKPLAMYSSVYSFLDAQHFRLYSSAKPDTLMNKNAPSQLSGRDENATNPIPKPEEDKSYFPLDYIDGKTIEYGNSNRIFQKSLIGRTVLNYDYNIGNSHHAIDYRYFSKDYTYLGLTIPSPQDQNFGNQWKTYETVPYNNEQMTEGYLRNRMVKGAFKSSFMTARCPVNESRILCEKANVLIPSPERTRSIDFQMSGRWMTYAITDNIKTNGYATSEVTFARDSFWLAEGDYLERATNTWEDQISELA